MPQTQAAPYIATLPRPAYESSFWTTKEVYETSHNRRKSRHSGCVAMCPTAHAYRPSVIVLMNYKKHFSPNLNTPSYAITLRTQTLSFSPRGRACSHGIFYRNSVRLSHCLCQTQNDWMYSIYRQTISPSDSPTVTVPVFHNQTSL